MTPLKATFAPCLALFLFTLPLLGQAPTHTCTVDDRPATAGSGDLVVGNYAAAEAFYRSALERSALEHGPASGEAHLGIVRALIGQDKVEEARSEAATYLAKNPTSAPDNVAAGEAAYRAADFAAAQQYQVAALRSGLCDADALSFASQLAGLTGLYAKQAQLIASAHALRPSDKLIRHRWISSLPPRAREAEMAKLLADPAALSDNERAYYGELDAALKQRPENCHITSASPSARIPFQPLDYFGNRPGSYGLDTLLNQTKSRLVISTSGSGITISGKLAHRLNLTPDGPVDKAGNYFSHVDSVRVGDITFSGCTVEVANKFAWGAIGAPQKSEIEGAIGLELFTPWLVTLDFQAGEFRLLPARPGETEAIANDLANYSDRPRQDRYVAPEMQQWIRLLRAGDNLLVPATLNKGAPQYVSIYSIEPGTYLSTAFAEKNGKVRHMTDWEVREFDGTVIPRYAILDAHLSLGLFDLLTSGYMVIDTRAHSHVAGVDISGLIGQGTLSRFTVSIDYRDNLMRLQYDLMHGQTVFGWKPGKPG